MEEHVDRASSSDTKLVLGMGNPGIQYSKTRHNIGFRVLDHLATLWNLRFHTSPYQGLIAENEIDGQKCVLIKPLTYMNLSGKCARAVLKQYGVSSSFLLVVNDDLHLPIGKIRLRRSGSSGGHRGLESIISYLGSMDFPRLKIGIGNALLDDMVSYVLSPFSDEEEQILTKIIPLAGEVIISWIREDIEIVMNRYNSAVKSGNTLSELNKD